MIAPTSAARKQQSPQICPGKERMVYTLWSRTTRGKYTRTGRNPLQKSRWQGMTIPVAWGILFTIESTDRLF
jgi:hypothetical protein